MENLLQILLLLGFGFVTGFQHGIDLDHIVAITDMTNTQQNRRRAVWYVALYGIGHGIVVILLGLVLVGIGQSLSESVNMVFEKIAGLTLIILGFYVLYSLYRHGKNFKLKSRWMLIFDAIKFGYHRLLHNFEFSHKHADLHEQTYEPKSAFTIGMIHGVGAETPTQITALAAVLGIGSASMSIAFLFTFVFGIFISNVALAAVLSFGILKLTRWNSLYLTVGFIAAFLSMITGTMFLLS